MDIEMTPAKFAMFIIKVNILIFLVTVGVNTFTLFPYMLHLNQVVNNIALDVANRNYITDGNIKQYVKHLTITNYTSGATIYSQQTFKEADMSGSSSDSSSMSNLGNMVKMGKGSIVFANSLSTDSQAATFGDSTGHAVVSVTVKEKSSNSSSGQSLILNNLPTDFNPLENPENTKTAMDNGYGGGKLVQRGHAFEVKMKTRYKLSGGAFGFMIHSAIPLTVLTEGVTTQYYQYDK